MLTTLYYEAEYIRLSDEEHASISVEALEFLMMMDYRHMSGVELARMRHDWLIHLLQVEEVEGWEAEAGQLRAQLEAMDEELAFRRLLARHGVIL